MGNDRIKTYKHLFTLSGDLEFHSYLTNKDLEFHSDLTNNLINNSTVELQWLEH